MSQWYGFNFTNTFASKVKGTIINLPLLISYSSSHYNSSLVPSQNFKVDDSHSIDSVARNIQIYLAKDLNFLILFSFSRIEAVANLKAKMDIVVLDFTSLVFDSSWIKSLLTLINLVLKFSIYCNFFWMKS